MLGNKYNEKKQAEIMLTERKKRKYSAGELLLIALHYRDILGYKPKQRMEALYEFCESYYLDYNKVLHYRMIDSTLRKANNKKLHLIDIPQIPVYQGEVDYINSLDIDYIYKKVMFAFLVKKKLERQIFFFRNGEISSSKYFRGVLKKYNDVKRMAKIPQNLNINSFIIHNLWKMGYVNIGYRGMIELTYLENCLETGHIAISVENYDNAGWYLDYYNGMNGVKLCKYCNQPFRQTRKDIKYCSEHKQYYIPVKTKKLTCICCGTEFEVAGMVKNKPRCDICQAEHRKERNRNRPKK